MTLDRRTVYVILLALALGWWSGSSPRSPINPHPAPDRPVLTALARLARTAARLGLWIAFAAEPPPETRQQLVRGPRRDDAGHTVIDHAEGW